MPRMCIGHSSHPLASCAGRDLRDDIFSTRSHNQPERSGGTCGIACQWPCGRSIGECIVPLFVEVTQPLCWAPSRTAWLEVKCYKAAMHALFSSNKYTLTPCLESFLDPPPPPLFFFLIPSLCTVRHGCFVSPFTSPGPRSPRCTVA